MFEFQFKDIPENGSFAGKTVVLPTPSGDEQTKIDELPRGEPLTDLEIEEYEKHMKKCGYTLKRPTPPHKK